jgi:hypothetical protein
MSPAPEPKTQAEQDEQKAKPEDLKPQPGKADEEEVDSEDEQPAGGDVKELEAGLPSRPKPTVEDDEDGDDGASFQEVAL